MTTRAQQICLCILLFMAVFAVADDSGKSASTEAAKTVAADNLAQAESTVLSYGFEQRVRTEDWNNILDYTNSNDDERRQMRYRTRAWMKYKSEPVEIGVGLVDEFYKKYALKPADVAADRLNLDEVVFENLYLKFNKLVVPGLSLSIGRLDMPHGEGFIMFDGTSGDGSRTSYFNGVNLTYQRGKSKFEAFGILDPKRDRFLGVIHDQHKLMQEWDEQAIGVYYTNREWQSMDIDAYYFYKKETHDYRPATNPLFQPDRNLQTLGARLVRRFDDGYSVTGEFAEQWGNQHANAAQNLPAAEIRAWGSYVYGRKTFASAWKPYVQLGYTALSGDDPNDKRTARGFDPLFSRWPKWSELVVYSMVPEKGIAYWTNNRMLQAEVGFNPMRALKLRATLYDESAFHPSMNGATTFSNGTHRGENYQVRADYTFSNHWRCHALYENFAPGDFYKGRSESFFVQAQVVYQFTSQLHIGNR